MSKVRHVLGISGGKDSAALAIYMKKNYPELDIEYYTSDTGKELQETYDLISNLETFLGKKITVLKAVNDSSEDNPFDHFIKLFKGYLPSSNARWCTKKLKLDPFENFVGDDPVISYVGIRGDEDREGYISKKSNIQSIFPFRKSIWSEDVISKVLSNKNISFTSKILLSQPKNDKTERILELINTEISTSFSQSQKLNSLLDLGIKEFNSIVFEFLKSTEYPLSTEELFPLINNEDILVRDDIFKLLEDSGVGVPAYYKEVEFEINGEKSSYARSRSGCFFCFYQQKIEWIWLYEQHPDLFYKALEYEKDGYTWMQDESLEDIIKPERIAKIKEDHLKRTNKKALNKKSPYLLDLLDDAEGEGCASCFI
ncbi:MULTISPECIES: phosphoadenosine phosphosulfate reductase family protein [Flavobacterium]|uniref:Phosphoadenosine phosphosulfate reductase family protein n=1 Tax=Flavobacterium cutihirudinis TaxID=1265740 RepID=A0A3D9G1E4_9FLAO|nr:MULTISPECIES: phosphoadenosine phosphosulfate reductase family protein [Flavobacterium]MBZ4040945.1 phosphoadenosine phosphosulfate reductase family protein [Flavobacterium hibisci]RED27009.1 phosphoadenosine phosphosulfate reductase family protein [Flavobacterium cutihirudinis]